MQIFLARGLSTARTCDKVNNFEPETLTFSISKIFNKIFRTISRNAILISNLRYNKNTENSGNPSVLGIFYTSLRGFEPPAYRLGVGLFASRQLPLSVI